MKQWISDASSVASVARGNDLTLKKEYLKKAFGSNLRLTHQKAPGSALEPWAAPRAAPTSRNYVPRAGFEPAILWLKTRCPGPLDERGNNRIVAKSERKRNLFFLVALTAAGFVG